MTRIPKIEKVVALKEHKLLLTFHGGVQKIYDCSKIIQLDRFQLIRQEAFFKAVVVDPGGYGVSWSDEMDLSAYELWNNGVEVSGSMVVAEETATQRKARSEQALCE